MQKGEVRNPITVLILGLVTCGIYSIIWLFSIVGEINEGLGREEFNIVKELLLSIVTCGLWGYWFMWRLCESVVELQRAWGVEPEMDGPIIFVLSIFGIGPLFIQQGLNNAWENGSPGGAGGYGTAGGI